MNIEEYTPVGWEDFPSTKTPITAANLKKMDEQIKKSTDAVIEMSREIPIKLTALLSAGQTRTVFNNAAIKEDGTYLLWTDNFNVSPTNITVTDGILAIEWPEQKEDLHILIKIYKEDK